MHVSAVLRLTLSVVAAVQALKTSAVPQHWRLSNAIRTIDLTRTYAQEQVAVILENISEKPQTVVHVPKSSTGSHLDAREKTKATTGSPPEALKVTGDAQYWTVYLPRPVPAGEKITLSLSSSRLHQLKPKPQTMDQSGKQYLEYSFNPTMESAYLAVKQKTKLKLPNSDIKESAGGEVSGSTVVYGPFEDVKAGAVEGAAATVRFEHTAPLTVVRYFERDIEVSHWGGNIAFEDRYQMTNNAARLRKQFDRIEFSSHRQPGPSAAITGLPFRLPKGTRDVYYTDEIGNVTTSRFRKTKFEAMLEVRPRYPIFGNWNYTFTLGWNNHLGRFMTHQGNQHVLRVPFMEGTDNVAYDDVLVKVILPEGAKVKQIETLVPFSKQKQGIKKTFMDTTGRTVLAFEAQDLTDEIARGELLIAYEYTTLDRLRKPLTVTVAVAALFALSMLANKVL